MSQITQLRGTVLNPELLLTKLYSFRLPCLPLPCSYCRPAGPRPSRCHRPEAGRAQRPQQPVLPGMAALHPVLRGEQRASLEREAPTTNSALVAHVPTCWGQENLGRVGQLFSSSCRYLTAANKAGIQEVGTHGAFCGQPCPLRLFLKSTKEILYIPRNGADFDREACQAEASQPTFPPSSHFQGIWKFRI